MAVGDGALSVEGVDGRQRPRIPAEALLWALLVEYLLRDGAHHAVEGLVRSRARRALRIRRPFADDALAYFTEHLDVDTTRAALVTTLRQTNRDEPFDDVLLIGLVLDGTSVTRCPEVRCRLCHPIILPPQADGPNGRSPAAAADRPTPVRVGEVVGQHHKLSLLSVVGGSLVLPLDVEPYGPHDSEQYVIGDSLYATAPFL